MPTDFVDYGADYGVIYENGEWTGSVKGTMEGVGRYSDVTLASFCLKLEATRLIAQ